MIIVKIVGGLGNQLFTYAAGYALAKDNNTDLILDTIDYQRGYKRKYCINELSLDYKSQFMNLPTSHIRLIKSVYIRYHNFKLKKKYDPICVTEQEEFTYQEISISQNRNTYLTGYWQNYRYFHKYREDLIRQFSFAHVSDTAKDIAEQLISKNMVCMHIRRGDYNTIGDGSYLAMDYYEKAMSLFDNKQHGDFLVFSDDIEFCKSYFAARRDVVYISDIAKLTDLEEFYVMTRCKSLILANSTFSWWAAYLSGSQMVVAPVVGLWKEDFYIPEWTKINTELERGKTNTR